MPHVAHMSGCLRVGMRVVSRAKLVTGRAALIVSTISLHVVDASYLMVCAPSSVVASHAQSLTSIAESARPHPRGARGGRDRGAPRNDFAVTKVRDNVPRHQCRGCLSTGWCRTTAVMLNIRSNESHTHVYTTKPPPTSTGQGYSA